jgi:hypothetical protein
MRYTGVVLARGTGVEINQRMIDCLPACLFGFYQGLMINFADI